MENKILVQKIWNDDVDCNRCRIKELVLFAHLTEDDFSHIHLPISDHSFEQSKEIYREGAKGQFIYTIRSGLVKLEVKQAGSNQKIVRLLSRGDVTGLEVLIGQTYHHTATVIESCQVCKIPIDVIHELQVHSDKLCTDLMSRWDLSVCHADEWLVDLNTGPARQRVVRFIDYLLNNSTAAPEFILPSRDDIASILSLTKETVSRIIAELKRENYIVDFGNGLHEGYISKLPKTTNV